MYSIQGTTTYQHLPALVAQDFNLYKKLGLNKWTDAKEREGGGGTPKW